MEIRRDATVYNYPTVVIVEIMGRHAGWLAGSAALGNVLGEGPDLVYLPEADFNMERFLHDLNKVYKEKGSCIVAVSEGIHDENGTFIAEYGPGLASLDSFGHKQLGGCAATLVAFVKDKLGIQKIRGIELSVLQRWASHCASERDIEESFAAGQKAVEAAVSGATDQMVCFVREKDENGNYRCGLKMENLSLAANAEKKVPREWINSTGNNVEQPFIDYVLPLIQGEPQLHYEQGLPRFARLKKILAN